MSQALITRRNFIKSSAALLAAANLPSLRSAAPFERKGEPRLLLSLAAYSFRDYMKETNHKRENNTSSDKRMDLFQFVDYCADHGCAGAELTSYYFPQKFSRDYLIRLKRHAFLRGVAVSGTAVGNTFTFPPGPKRDEQMASVKEWIGHAAVLGAPHIRVFAGTLVGTKEESIKRSIEALEEAGEHAGKHGIFLGLENHGGIVAEADAILEIVKAVKSPWVGVNLDTGNFQTDDPYRDLERIAPYAVNVQIKADMHPRGQKAGPADLPRLVKILRAAKYQGFVALEYESKEDPYAAVPGLLKKLKELCES